MISYPRESVEFQPVHVTIDGSPVTTGVTFAITSRGGRPEAWVSPVELGGQIGVMVGGLEIGGYSVWAKVIAAPETPVVNCGSFWVT